MEREPLTMVQYLWAFVVYGFHILLIFGMIYCVHWTGDRIVA